MPAHRVNSVIINSHITFVRYVMHKVDFLSKFNATIRSDSCNREYFVGDTLSDMAFYTRKGRAGNPNAPDADVQCNISLKTVPNYYLTVNITLFNLEGYNCTSGDVVEFRDSPDTVLAFNRFCGFRNKTDANYQLSSMENQMLVTFKRVNYQSPNATKARSEVIKFSVAAKYRSKWLIAITDWSVIVLPFYIFRMHSHHQCKAGTHGSDSIAQFPNARESPVSLLLAPYR